MKSRKNKSKGVQILVAEDSPTQAEKLQYLLEEHGFAVVLAPDGKQALAAAKRHRPALIVSDVLMPEMDGFALCGEIKRDDQLKDVPVILLTTLSDVRDIMKGLECGADNFIRKPYEDSYLLARVDYLLMNNELRKNQKMQIGVEIYLGGQKHFITAERQQIVDLLISVYEEAVHLSEELKAQQRELADSNSSLICLYHVAESLNHAMSEREVCDKVLERVMDLPGVQAGWISLWENDAFRMAAVRNLPPALMREGAMDGLCECRRRFLAGKLDHVANILECERLKHAKGDTHGLRYHAAVPLWGGDRSLGVMNLVGANQGLFKDDELETLYGIGHQVGIALERIRLHEHLEQLVEDRTVALTAEISERKQAETKLRLFRTLLDNSADAIEVIDPVTLHLLDINEAECRVLGYSREELLSMSVHDIDPVMGAETLKMIMAKLQQSGHARFETVHRRKDGSTFPVEVSTTSIELDKPYLLAIVRDITEHKLDEAKIKRLTRIYSVLSGINTVIVRVHEEEELFRDACRIAVEHGGFIFGWIGKLDADSQQVRPVAWAGHGDGYLEQINLTARVDAPGNCVLTAQALTKAKPMICNDIASDERIGNWRSEALSRGYRSVAVFPLMLADRPIGVFVLYAPESDVFDEMEMRLLVEAAGDISFALDHLEQEKRLNYLAYFDVITGLPNRTLFLDRIAQKINFMHHAGEAFCLIMFDLDRFSGINETLGRQAGDDLLRQVTRRLQGILDETDILAHFAADHFGIAARHDDGNANIGYCIERILSAIQNQPFLVGGSELRVSARAGVSSYPADGEDIESLLRNSEAALKKAKLTGDKYLFYAPAFNALVGEKLLLENKLRQALELKQLVLYYQPKVNLGNGRISGLEALLRWNDPQDGLVPPMKFIPLLEETGMILEVGQWVLEKAISDSLAWQTKGLQSPRIAVNISQIQLQQKDFVSMIGRVVKGDQAAASRLELEITESLVMHDIVENIQKLRMIREMGVEVAIDDFGTGYSSLSYIAKLPVNTLKIDRAFIMNMTSSSDDLSIVSTIISLAHSLNIRVVAEGVETIEQAKLLHLLRCDEIQGFLFSPAVPAEQIEEFLHEKKSLFLA